MQRVLEQKLIQEMDFSHAISFIKIQFYPFRSPVIMLDSRFLRRVPDIRSGVQGCRLDVPPLLTRRQKVLAGHPVQGESPHGLQHHRESRARIREGIRGRIRLRIRLISKASRGWYQHVQLTSGEGKREATAQVEEALRRVEFERTTPFKGCYAVEYLDIKANAVVSDELMKNLSLTLVGVFVVVLVMVGDLRVSLWVFFCILFTLVGIAGGIGFAGLTVEIVTSILLILSVGLAVDYSTHIAHRFMITHAPSRNGAFGWGEGGWGWMVCIEGVSGCCREGENHVDEDRAAGVQRRIHDDVGVLLLSLERQLHLRQHAQGGGLRS